LCPWKGLAIVTVPFRTCVEENVALKMAVLVPSGPLARIGLQFFQVARDCSEIRTQFCSENLYGRGFLEDLIKINLEEIAGVDVKWVHVAQDRDQW
jgi:hypothetical protein